MSYDWITSEAMETAIREAAEGIDLLALPGVWPIVAEECNNTAIELIEADPEKYGLVAPAEPDDDDGFVRSDGMRLTATHEGRYLGAFCDEGAALLAIWRDSGPDLSPMVWRVGERGDVEPILCDRDAIEAADRC